MKRMVRGLSTALALLLILSGLPRTVLADNTTPLVIYADASITVDVPESEAPYALLVQATSVTRASATYILTLTNLSPWPMSALRVLDRYFSVQADPETELHHEWLPRRLAPGESASHAIRYPDGFLADGCHQIEISIVEGLGTVLIDCSSAASTSLWNVPLTEEMQAYLDEPILTRTEPVGASKLGLHVTTVSPEIMEFVRTARPAVVVAVGGVGWLNEVKEDCPEIITVGRLLEGDQSFIGNPTVRAREFVAAHTPQYLANPGVDYWLGWNEPDITLPWQMSWYAVFEAERALAMAELGLRVAVGNFGVGNPEAVEFTAFMPAIAAAREYDGVFALHEYSAPSMSDGLGSEVPGLEGDAECGALTLRYRYWYDEYLQPNDLVVPLIITEAGIDGGVLPENEGQGGWTDFTSGGEYVGQLSWYDDELRRDPYVLGFAIYNAGDLDGRWQTWDVSALLPDLTDVITSKP